LQHLVTKGLTATADLWLDIQAGYAWVHRTARILTHPEQYTTQDVQRQYQSQLDECIASPKFFLASLYNW